MLSATALPDPWPAFVVAGVLVALFATFVREWLKPDVAVLCAVSMLLALGLLSPPQVLSVLSNSAPVTVACLFVLSGALARTGCVDRLGDWLGRAAGASERRLLLALLACGLCISPFVNNTPLVMVMIPAVLAAAQRHGLAASRLLIPLSYATILGGLMTMVGTSTNILVDGTARALGLAPFRMFEMTLPALGLALTGAVFMLVFAPRWLPVRESLTQQFAGGAERPYLTELFVPADSRLAGRTLQDARLAHGTVEVLQLRRGDETLARPAPETRLAPGDRLVVHGRGSTAMIALRGAEAIGLTAAPEALAVAHATVGTALHAADLETLQRRDVLVVETLVGPGSRYLQRPLRDLDLLARYGIHLVAVHRRDASIATLGEDFQLHAGDVLLIEGTAAQVRRFCDNGDLIALGEGRRPQDRTHKAPIAVATIAGVMGLAAFDAMPIEALAIIGTAVVLATGCIRPEEAYKSIEWPIVVMIFGMLAVGIAMQQSGLAARLAGVLASFGTGLSPWLMLSLVILLTSIATEFVSNNAVAVLFTPIAVAVAQQLGVDPRPFVVGVMFAASLSFATPIGYQTNMLVYGAGHYRFADFARLGVPMNVVTWLAASVLIPLFWPLVPR